MSEPFVKIDLHGLRQEEAMKVIDKALASAGTTTYQLQLIHGYNDMVRPEYQKQGFMRQMMEYVYVPADKRGVPVILDTDDKDKSLRYQHLGMSLYRIRNCGERFHMYDLIRE